MSLLVIDNEYHNYNDAGADGLRTILEVVYNFEKVQKIKLIQGEVKLKEFLSRSSVKDFPVTLIHESFGMSWTASRRNDTREQLAIAVEEIRLRNPLSRICLYGFAYNLPLLNYVEQVKADAFWRGDTDPSCLEEIVKRGQVTPEEYRQRGKTIEIIGRPNRVTALGYDIGRSDRNDRD